MVEDANAKVETSEDLSLQEEFTKAENEETGAVEDSSTQEKSAEEESQEEVQEETKPDDESALEELDNDEDFQTAKKELETEMGGKELSFAQTKKFRKTYWQVKENERKNQDLQTQLDELQDKKLSDNELLGETVKRGLLEQEPSPAKTETKKLDLKALREKATPEQREWLDIIEENINQSISPLQDKLKEYETRFGDISTTQRMKDIQAEEEVLRKDVKEKYGLDYDKDIFPEMSKLTKELSKNIPKNMTLLDAGWTPSLLVNQVLVARKVQLAKKTVTKETNKLNAAKKKANIETDTVQGVPGSNDENKNLREILSEEMDKEGLSKFK